MASESSRQGRSSETDSDSVSSSPATAASIVDSIKTLAAYNARAELNTEEQIILFLRSWWSKVYNRPLKDPLLATYTLEELLYEFYDRKEREEAADERTNSENDKMEEEKDRIAGDWAEQEEKREAELEAATAAKTSTEPIDPTKDPANIAWMEEQIRKAKELHGESFGEDVKIDFEE